MDLLAIHRIPAFRVNQRPVETTRGWRNSGADEGAPDIFGCLPGGRVITIECKTGTSHLSKLQMEVIDIWRLQGAEAIMVRSVAQLHQLLNAYTYVGGP